MQSLLFIGMFLLGIVQFAAIVSGFIEIFGTFFGIAAAFFLGEFPILGTIMGIIGAMNNWGWSFVQAVLLFLGTPAVLFIFGIFFSSRR